MNHQTLSIRQAVAGDIPQIWSLLHAESKSWSETKISESLDELFLLMIEEKMVGVLYKPGKEKRIEWVVIHPMYPEKKLGQIMIQMLDFSREATLLELVGKLGGYGARVMSPGCKKWET